MTGSENNLESGPGSDIKGKRQHAPATARNRDPILAVLKRVLPRQGTILEIASGTGEHAVYLAPRFYPGVWQPSDPAPGACDSIQAWIAAAGHSNIHPPLEIDVRASRWPVEDDEKLAASIRSMICINMIHIAPWEATLGLMAGAGRLLPHGGILYLYGPYRLNGIHTAPSNVAFDQTLRSQNQTWGIRDLEKVAETALEHGLELVETVPMPANNLSVIFRKT